MNLNSNVSTLFQFPDGTEVAESQLTLDTREDNILLTKTTPAGVTEHRWARSPLEAAQVYQAQRIAYPAEDVFFRQFTTLLSHATPGKIYALPARYGVNWTIQSFLPVATAEMHFTIATVEAELCILQRDYLDEQARWRRAEDAGDANMANALFGAAVDNAGHALLAKHEQLKAMWAHLLEEAGEPNVIFNTDGGVLISAEAIIAASEGPVSVPAD